MYSSMHNTTLCTGIAVHEEGATVIHDGSHVAAITKRALMAVSNKRRSLFTMAGPG